MVGRFLGLSTLLVAFSAGTAAAQSPASLNEIEAKNKGHVQDRGNVWVLRFRFNPPRLITADIPGRGRRLCWYMLYHVSNPDPKEPITVHPEFELKTFENRISYDQILPSVQKAIQQVEDPTGHLDIKNSVTIADHPLPPTKPESTARWVTGVAIWDDVSSETNQFSIFITGLSNGWSVDDKDVIRRKTLQLNFRRLGDRTNQDARDIRFTPPEEWVYRATSMKLPAAAKDLKPKAAVPQPGKEK